MPRREGNRGVSSVVPRQRDGLLDPGTGACTPEKKCRGRRTLAQRQQSRSQLHKLYGLPSLSISSARIRHRWNTATRAGESERVQVVITEIRRIRCEKSTEKFRHSDARGFLMRRAYLIVLRNCEIARPNDSCKRTLSLGAFPRQPIFPTFSVPTATSIRIEI